MIEIVNWDDFENAKTRKLVKMNYVGIPSGCSSRGYRHLMREGSRGIKALGVFTALLQLMASFDKDKRGKFVNRDGSGMEVADLREMTGIQLADLEEGIELLLTVKWLRQIDHSSATHPPLSSHSPPIGVPIGEDRIGEEREEGGGGSRLDFEDGNGKEQTDNYWPTRDEVMSQLGSVPYALTQQCAEAYFDARDAVGWMIKNQPIRNWRSDLKSFARSWQNNGGDKHAAAEAASSRFSDPNGRG